MNNATNDCWRHRLRGILGFVPLVAVNLVPLFGALFLGWNSWQLLFLYWAETIIIAFFGLVRFGAASIHSAVRQNLRDLALAVFFLLFMTVFFLGFLLIIGGILFANMYVHSGFSADYNPFWPGRFTGPGAVSFSFRTFFRSPLLGIAGFFVGQLYYLIRDFLIPARYRRADVIPFLTEPLKRIVIMHLATLTGGWFIARYLGGGTPNSVFLIWIGLKVFLDLVSYAVVVARHNPGLPGGQYPRAIN